jgi:hypothetical protein
VAKLYQGLTGAAKEQAEQEPLIGQHDRIPLMWQGEHGVKIGSRQEFSASGLNPFGLRHGLAFRTVAVSTRVVSLPLKATLSAVLEMTAQAGRAASDEIIDEALLKGR